MPDHNNESELAKKNDALMKRTRESAVEIIKKHLFPVLEELHEKQYNRADVSYAFIYWLTKPCGKAARSQKPKKLFS